MQLLVDCLRGVVNIRIMDALALNQIKCKFRFWPKTSHIVGSWQSGAYGDTWQTHTGRGLMGIFVAENAVFFI